MPWTNEADPRAGFWSRVNINPALEYASEQGLDVQFAVRVKARRGRARRGVRYAVLEYRDGRQEIVEGRRGAVFVPFYSHGIHPDTFTEDLWAASGYDRIRDYFTMRIYDHPRLDPESLGQIDYIVVRFIER